MRDGRAPVGALRAVEYVPGAGLQPVCGQRPNQRWWLTAAGVHAISAQTPPDSQYPDDGGDNHDDRTITVDDDNDGYTTVHVTADDGTYVEYHQRPDGGSFPRALPSPRRPGDAR